MQSDKDPKRPTPDTGDAPADQDARNTAGDMDAGDPADGAEAQDAARGDAVAPDSARAISDVEAEEAGHGEPGRSETVDAHDVAGDTPGALR